MKLRFRSSFERDLLKIADRKVLQRVNDVIEQIKRARSPEEVAGLKKLQGGSGYYRIRTGDYRIGCVIEQDTVAFVRCLHRREIYRYFP